MRAHERIQQLIRENDERLINPLQKITVPLIALLNGAGFEVEPALAEIVRSKYYYPRDRINYKMVKQSIAAKGRAGAHLINLTINLEGRIHHPDSKSPPIEWFGMTSGPGVMHACELELRVESEGITTSDRGYVNDPDQLIASTEMMVNKCLSAINTQLRMIDAGFSVEKCNLNYGRKHGQYIIELLVIGDDGNRYYVVASPNSESMTIRRYNGAGYPTIKARNAEEAFGATK